MRFVVNDEEGTPLAFECADSLESRWTCGAILEGRTYPHLPFVGDVATILDVGANCGAFSVHAARRYPDARIHAFEPGGEARSYLERNTTPLPNVVVHPFGLFDRDRSAVLHHDAEDLGRASVRDDVARDPTAGSETVQLRDAGAWADEVGLDDIDILKVDVEGCELEVLGALSSRLATVKVLYVEYDHRDARRTIDRLLAETHDLYLAFMLALDQGECLYLRRDLADHPAAVDRLRELFTRPRSA